MKGLDLSSIEDQLKLLWIPVLDPERYTPGKRYEVRMFVGGRQDDPHTYRIRTENLTCLCGGGRHQWEERGRDFTNKGVRGIVEVDVSVCTNCGRDKR